LTWTIENVSADFVELDCRRVSVNWVEVGDRGERAFEQLNCVMGERECRNH